MGGVDGVDGLYSLAYDLLLYGMGMNTQVLKP